MQLDMFNEREDVALKIKKKKAAAFSGADIDAWANDNLTDRIVEGSEAFNYKDYSVKIVNPASRYKVASALQKCIRRGMPERAVYYAQAIFNSADQSYLWSRLPVIVLEDVASGNWEFCALMMHFSRWAAVRKKTDQIKALSWLVHELATGAKSRALCEAVCCAYFIRHDKDPLTNRIGDAMAYLGWKPEEKTNPWLDSPIQRDRKVVDEQVAAVTSNPYILYTYHCGNKKSCAFLNAAVPVVVEMENSEELKIINHELPEYTMVAGVPDWSLDKHTRDGIRANKIFLSTNDLLPAWVSPAAFNRILFQAETALVDKEATNTELMALKLHAEDIEAESVDVTLERHKELRAIMATSEFRQGLTDARIKACS